jgi:hypothetical protein
LFTSVLSHGWCVSASAATKAATKQVNIHMMCNCSRSSNSELRQDSQPQSDGHDLQLERQKEEAPRRKERGSKSRSTDEQLSQELLQKEADDLSEGEGPDSMSKSCTFASSRRFFAHLPL